MGFSNWVHLDVELVKRETDGAFLCVIDGDEVWLPKSQIDDPGRLAEGDEGVTVSVTEWIAKQKGLD